jgi:hypothetical protein
MTQQRQEENRAAIFIGQIHQFGQPHRRHAAAQRPLQRLPEA